VKEHERQLAINNEHKKSGLCKPQSTPSGNGHKGKKPCGGEFGVAVGGQGNL